MGIGVSIVFIAVGAILAFAVHTTLSGVSIQTVGVILMVVGAIGLVVAMTLWGPRRTPAPYDHEHILDEHTHVH